MFKVIFLKCNRSPVFEQREIVSYFREINKSNTLIRYLTVCLLTICNCLQAVSNPSESDMVVVGSRTDVSIARVAADITVITKEDIERSGASTVAEILRGVSSIQIADNSTNATLSLRGFSAEQTGSNTLILINGRRLNYSDLAAPQLATIQVNEITRIEILNTSAGVLYGDQAVAGVINIITTDNQNGTDLSLGFGSFDKLSLGISTQIKINSNWQIKFSAKDENNDHYRQHNEEELQQQQLNLKYHSEDVEFIIGVESTQQHINTPGALLESDVILDRQLSRTEFNADFLKIDSTNYQFSVIMPLEQNWIFAAELLQNQDDNSSLTSFVNFTNTFVSDTQRELTSFTPRISSNFETEFGTATFTAGFDSIISDYSFSLLGRDNTQQSLSGYVETSFPVSENFILSAGARYSEVNDELVDAFTYSLGIDIENKATSYNLGLIYNLDSKYRLYARVEKNFRFAKVDEQAFTSPGVIGLEPQLGVSIDFGVSASMRDSNWKLALYQLKLEDEIIFDSAATPPAGAFFQGANINADKSKREGLRFEVNHQLNNDLSIALNTAWVDARLTSGSSENNKIPGVSRNVSRLDFNYQPTDSVNMNLEYIYTGKRKQEGDNGGLLPSLDAYSLLNLAVQYRFNGSLSPLQLTTRINNLLDEDYISFAQFNGFYPAAGINASVNLRYRFEN